MAKLRPRAELLLGDAQTPLDLLAVVGAAPDQAGAQCLRGGRRDEHLHRLGQRGAHLAGSLHLDLEHHRDARAHAALELGAKRPVAPPGVVGVLDELSCGHAAVELVVAEEVVVDAVALSRTGTARGGRDRQLEAGNPLHQPADQRPLAHSGRPRDDEHARHRLTLFRGAVGIARRGSPA